ncbi:hypothetical protein D5018_00260 [Parashewanella curva]|uniref:Flagellar biosynthesis protein FlgT n=1 Tax=Parashewanella curva TaxID=2338552 RepID=A0A3L8Q1N4_9GAMM|nr:flagellar assembly protein T N-terminal domain-containing protein [Parashewanella curva]RLV61587.1 hypothetical protein D5018_00260 [Parashewanella curva]
MVMLHRAFVLLALLLLALGFSRSSTAEDFYFQGQAPIINGNIKQARQQAIESAIQQAKLESGVRVNSTRSTLSGQLIQGSTELASVYNSEQIELVSERTKGDVIYVNVRITSHQNEFPLSGKASIYLPRFVLSNPAHLRYGQLNDFSKMLTEKFSDSLSQKAKLSFPELRAEQSLNLTQHFFEDNSQKLPYWIGDMTNSQYVLIGNILNAEVISSPESFLGLFEDWPTRQFRINLSLFHNISGEKIWQKTYFINEVWEFESNKILSASSTELWHSKYGQAIKRLFNSIAVELDNHLRDRPLMGTVIAKKSKLLIVNLGRRNNIQVGDTLKLVLRKDLHTRFQSIKTIAQSSPIKLKVTQITEQTAVVEWNKANKIENIQVGDIVIAKSI